MVTIYQLMDLAIERGASDLHVSVGKAPVLRTSQGLAAIEGMETLRPEDTEKLVREVCPEKNFEELTREGTTDFGYAHEDKARFRVSAFKQKHRFGLVMRLIPHKLLSFEEIGLPSSIQDLLSRPRGLVLVTGPTGSGKTTTLATMIDWINTNLDRHIVTIEDPIEYYHHHKKSMITQREVGEDVPSFAEAMRRVLRQDPDVILLGEMRDLETTGAAITAAETGHLVFGTLHTTGSARTVDRIIDQYPTNQQEQIRSQLAVSVQAVISQLLLPRADGSGRVAAFEIMLMNGAIENHIRKGETFKIPSVIQTNKRMGMMLLDEHLIQLVQEKKIKPKVAIDAAQDQKTVEERILSLG
ncbi:MAG TPA: PilT/PilU family type 4a pilus ATPase [Planctomycetes bacterium]|nr:PilT/PilU family type 4a pilus ATPase [Planctomycetota bacterium]